MASIFVESKVAPAGNSMARGEESKGYNNALNQLLVRAQMTRGAPREKIIMQMKIEGGTERGV